MPTNRFLKLMLPCTLAVGLTGCFGTQSETTSPAPPDTQTLQQALRGHFLQTMPQQNTNDLQITYTKALGHGAYLAMYLFHDENKLPHYGDITYVVSSQKQNSIQWQNSSDGAPLDSKAKYTFFTSQSNVDVDKSTVPCQFIGGLVNDPSIKEIVVLYDDGKTLDAQVDPVTHTFAAIRIDSSPKSPEPKATFAVDANWHLVDHTPPVPPAQ